MPRAKGPRVNGKLYHSEAATLFTADCHRCGRRVIFARCRDTTRRAFDPDPSYVLPADGLDRALPGYLPHYCRDRTDGNIPGHGKQRSTPD